MPEEDELLTWQKDVRMKLGVPWAPPKAQTEKPNRQALWLRAIDAEVRAGRTLPDGVTAAVPCAWLPGDSLAPTCVSDVEVVAAGELAKCDAVDETDPARVHEGEAQVEHDAVLEARGRDVAELAQRRPRSQRLQVDAM